MKEILNASILAFLLTIVCLIPIGLILWALWQPLSRLVIRWMAQEDEYTKLHDKIQKDMKKYTVEEARAKLIKLSSLKWKDSERTSVLETIFLREFFEFKEPEVKTKTN